LRLTNPARWATLASHLFRRVYQVHLSHLSRRVARQSDSHNCGPVGAIKNSENRATSIVAQIGLGIVLGIARGSESNTRKT
jgi:hypothetical protein